MELHTDTARDGGSQEVEPEVKWAAGVTWACVGGGPKRPVPALLLRTASLLGRETASWLAQATSALLPSALSLRRSHRPR